MYRSIIELKKDISPDLLSRLKENIEAAFSNRYSNFGELESTNHHCLYEGGKNHGIYN